MTRLLLKRPLSDLWLELEAPASEVSVTEVLNGPGSIDATLPVEYFTKKGEDGKPILWKGGTLVIAEREDGQINVGLLDSIDLGETTVSISAGGYSVIANGQPWMGEDKSEIQADPVRLFKDIWAWLQTDAQRKLGIRVTGKGSSAGRVGTALDKEAKAKADKILKLTNQLYDIETRLQPVVATYSDEIGKLFKAAGSFSRGSITHSSSAPAGKKNAMWINTARSNEPAIWVRDRWETRSGISWQVGQYMAAKANRDRIYGQRLEKLDEIKAAQEETTEGTSQDAGEPYVLNWYTTHDLGATIGELREAGPFEYVERAFWVGEDLDLTLQVDSPTLGGRKEDLRFELGVNVVAHPTVSTADPYNAVFATGAGEGSATLRNYKTLPADGRVRRVQVVSDKDARTQPMTNRVTDTAMGELRNNSGYLIDSLAVVDHSFARLNQFRVGDEINVIGLLPDGSELDVWVRILEITRVGEDPVVDLKVEAT